MRKSRVNFQGNKPPPTTPKPTAPPPSQKARKARVDHVDLGTCHWVVGYRVLGSFALRCEIVGAVGDEFLVKVFNAARGKYWLRPVSEVYETEAECAAAAETMNRKRYEQIEAIRYLPSWKD